MRTTLSVLGCCLLLACASDDEPNAVFHAGGLDGALPEPTVPAEAGVTPIDARVSVPDATVDAFVPPGVEAGRLAGFTDAHNAARARVSAKPALGPLVWSQEIALVAQSYADKLAAGCLDTLEHSTKEERQGYGENLASYGITGGTGREENGSASRTVELWESELACYTFGPFETGINDTCSAACAPYGGCGHYTQLVWRETKRMGCGVADCMEGRTRKSYWVCNYDPPGNFVDQLPY